MYIYLLICSLRTCYIDQNVGQNKLFLISNFRFLPFLSTTPLLHNAIDMTSDKYTQLSTTVWLHYMVSEGGVYTFTQYKTVCVWEYSWMITLTALQNDIATMLSNPYDLAWLADLWKWGGVAMKWNFKLVSLSGCLKWLERHSGRTNSGGVVSDDKCICCTIHDVW